MQVGLGELGEPRIASPKYQKHRNFKRFQKYRKSSELSVLFGAFRCFSCQSLWSREVGKPGEMIQKPEPRFREGEEISTVRHVLTNGVTVSVLPMV